MSAKTRMRKNVICDENSHVIHNDIQNVKEFPSVKDVDVPNWMTNTWLLKPTK